MRITYISTYPPRECGLASFNKNLIQAIGANNKFHSMDECATVVAVNADHADEYEYPSEVKYVISQQDQGDYTRAADFINSTDTDACILQHEFGIFGGENGIYVLSLINQLDKPLISILHTVLEKPSNEQRIIIQGIAKKSDKVVVMGKIAINLLHKVYSIPLKKIDFIEHGAPDYEPPLNNPLKADPLFGKHKILLTFGLISRNKGLETVVRALPEIVAKHRDVVYVILGNTHPGIKKNSGEEYREHLMKVAEDLGVINNIVFINRFVAEEELINYLSAADIYVSPYLNEAQITSGTLSYAVGAGAAIVATPYWHARELLDQERGVLFNFKDEIGLARVVNDLFDNPQKLNTIKENAYNYGLNLRWPVIGKQYLSILQAIIDNPDFGERIFRQVIDPEIMPEFSLNYVKRLTDRTGIIQHSKYGVPNWKEGYCIDDNARALILAVMACKLNYEDAYEMLPTYLSYLHYMQNDSGSFRNFLSYQREYLDEVGSEDAFGRTIWALGYLVNNAPSHSYSKFGEELFLNAAAHFRGLTYLRAISNTIIGICYYLKTHPSDNEMLATLDHLTRRLTDAYKSCKGENWNWFENYLTYDNAFLPLSLLHSAEITGKQEVLNIAIESMNFLEGLTLDPKYFSPVGNIGWHFRDGEKPQYDQQAVDAMAMALMYGQAYQMTNDYQYLKKMFSVYSWFLGENALFAPLYDSETKGCSDGLQHRGINNNQGAESTLAYLITQLTVLQALNNNSNYKSRKTDMDTSLAT